MLLDNCLDCSVQLPLWAELFSPFQKKGGQKGERGKRVRLVVLYGWLEQQQQPGWLNFAASSAHLSGKSKSAQPGTLCGLLEKWW